MNLNPFVGLPDLIEDTRHKTMRLRHWIPRSELKSLGRMPRILVDAASAAASATKDLDPHDQQELDLSNYLVGQFEEALIFLGSMIQE